MLDVTMGGRVAEELIFGAENVTTGASSDLRQATRLAREMVTKYGFSDKCGLASTEYGDYGLSHETRGVIEDEVKEMLHQANKRATKLLKSHEKELHMLAETLLDRETLNGAELRRLCGLKAKAGDAAFHAEAEKNAAERAGREKRTRTKSEADFGSGGGAEAARSAAAAAAAAAAAVKKKKEEEDEEKTIKSDKIVDWEHVLGKTSSVVLPLTSEMDARLDEPAVEEEEEEDAFHERVWRKMSKIDRYKCAVFKDLHEKGFTMTSAAKFGGDYLAYPGDPMLFHAYFTVRVLERGEKMTPLSCSSVTRMAHAARKNVVFAFCGEGGDEGGGSDDSVLRIRYFTCVPDIELSSNRGF